MTATLLAMALVGCPAGYWLLCGAMREVDTPRPPTIPFFLIFGTVGGWLLAFALSPSGLAAACLVFLAIPTPLALLASSIYLAVRAERTIFHRVAMWNGFGYPVVLGGILLVGALIR